jgi:hypothetical protein
MKFKIVKMVCLLGNLLNYQYKLFIKNLGRPRPDLPNLQTVAGSVTSGVRWTGDRNAPE